MINQKIFEAANEEKELIESCEDTLEVISQRVDKIALFQDLRDKIAGRKDDNQATLVVKFASSFLKELEDSEFEEYFAILYDQFLELVGTQSPSIRKAVIFSFVELYFRVPQERFDEYISSLNTN